MLAVLVSTCKHLSQQGGFQSDRIVKWACWRWPIAIVRGVCAVGTPFDILGGRGADGGGVRLDGSARGLGDWRCSRLGGLAVALVAWEGLVVLLAAWGASGRPSVMAPPRPVRGMVPQKCRT